MNPSTSSIPSREPSPSGSSRPESIALGLLLMAACLPAMWPHPTLPTAAPGPVPAEEAVHPPRETLPLPRSGAPMPATTGIRQWPATVITADAIAEETASDPAVLIVETVPAIGIVPLATPPPSPSFRP